MRWFIAASVVGSKPTTVPLGGIPTTTTAPPAASAPAAAPIAAGAPTVTKTASTPPPAISRTVAIASGPARTPSVAPKARASSSFGAARSTAMIRDAPARTAP